MDKIYIDLGTHDGGGFDEIVDALGITTDWKIFAFEPQPYAAKLYLDVLNNGKLKAFKNSVQFIQKAAWICDEVLPMFKEIHNKKWYDARPGEEEKFLKWQHALAEEKGHLWNPSKPLAVTKHYVDGEYALGGNTLAPIQAPGSHSTIIGDQHKTTWAQETEDVECIDFSAWMKENMSPDDNITLKVDIEGSEFHLLPKMIEDGTLAWVNHLLIEWHHHMYPIYRAQHNQIMNWLRLCPQIKISNWY